MSVSYVNEHDLLIETEQVIVSLKDGPADRASASWNERLVVTVRHTRSLRTRTDT